ncbi:MAG: 30S ribosome-binding factor RbfA [Desulfobacteraceae bacterium]|jgi:ribosome-binding factor A
MKSFSRSDRIGTRIQSCLSELLRKKISDPRLDMVTVTGVELTPDLHEAHIYFTVSSGEKAQRDAVFGFESASGFIRSSLAKQLGLRYMPKLRFFHDSSFDYGSRIDTILKSLKNDDQST